MGDVRVSPFASVYVRAIQDLEDLEDKLEAAEEKGLPMMVRFYQKRIADQQQVVRGAEALCDVGDMDDEDVESNPPWDRPVFTNPAVYEGPEVSDYEGMKVQFIPGEFKFPQVRESLDFVKFAEDLGLFADVRERVYAVYLNQKNRILGYRLVGSGDARSSIASPIIIFGPAMILHAAGFAVLHNHPSRELDPSPEDKAVAKRLIAGSELLSIHMLDFVVVGGNEYFSFRDDMPDLWQR